MDFNKELQSKIEERQNSNPYKHEIVQCRCEKLDTRANISDSDSDTNKASKNPLVIISVYPMPECCENIAVIENQQNRHDDIWTSKDVNWNHNLKQLLNSEKYIDRDKRNDNKVVRPISRSPSPSKNQNKTWYKSNFTDTKVLRTNSRRTSPERIGTLGVNSRQVKIAADKNVIKVHNTFNKESRGRSPQRNRSKDTKGTNTDHNVTKKNIVDNYMKKITEYMDQQAYLERKTKYPKKENSKVTVNIEGDKEQYNVFFQQDKATTDLKVKKIVKSTKNRDDDNFQNIFPCMKNYMVTTPGQSRKPQTVSRNEVSNVGFYF